VKNKKGDVNENKTRTTRKGRVVFNRRRHFFTLRRCVDILASLSNTLSSSELAQNPYACNALYEITRTAYYPVWQRAVYSAPDTEEKTLFAALEPELRAVFKQIVRETCDRVGEALGIPAYAREFVLNYLYDLIWNVIWTITDPFFEV